jgi:hypothetical protein
MKVVGPERRRAPRLDDPNLRGRRAEPRTRLLLEASAQAISCHTQVTLLEVSKTGARLSGVSLDPGKEVIIRSGTVDVFATVVWSEDEYCGVQFDEPLSAKDFVTLRALSAAANQSQLSPEERLGAADWLNGLAR